MTRIQLLLIFLFFLPVILSGQTWKGRVVNVDKETPFSYANVYLRDSLIGTITKDDGTFEIDCKGNIKLPLVEVAWGTNRFLLNLNCWV